MENFKDIEHLYQSLRINDTLPALDADKKRILMETVQAYADQSSTGWIKVEDKLPDNDDAIMLYDGSEVFQGWAEYDEDRKQQNDFYFGGNQRAYCITHWQPLPAPPLINNGEGKKD